MFDSDGSLVIRNTYKHDRKKRPIEEKEEHHVPKFGKKQKTGHIQNGKAEEYKSIFTPELNKVFESKFPNALAKLGYL